MSEQQQKGAEGAIKEDPAAALNTQVKLREKAEAEAAQLRAQLDGEVKELREKVGEAEKALAGRDATIAEREATIRELEGKLSAQTEATDRATEQPRKYRLTATIDADKPEKLAALAKQLSTRYGDVLQIGPNSGDFVTHGDAADCVAHVEIKPDEVKTEPAAQS